MEAQSPLRLLSHLAAREPDVGLLSFPVPEQEKGGEEPGVHDGHQFTSSSQQFIKQIK